MVEKLKNQLPIGQLCDQMGINYQIYRLYSGVELAIREAQSKQIKSKMLKVLMNLGKLMDWIECCLLSDQRVLLLARLVYPDE